jgi:hypothetical protein
MNRLPPRAAGLALLALVALRSAPLPPAHAGGPASVEVAGEEALAKGTLEALSLGADGVVRLGAAFEAVALEAPSAWAAAAVGETLYVGCGNDATLCRVAADGTLERIALGVEGDDALLVTALAPLGDGVAAAVFPGARIVRVGADAKPAPVAELAAEHVWALLPDGRGGLLAATGVPGAVWRVSAEGAVEKVCDVDDEHARCLAGAADDLLVGTAGKGRVLRVKDGRVSVLRDLEQDEVVGLVRLSDGSIVAAANADPAAGNAQQLAVLLKQIAQPAATRGEQKPQERAALQDGALLHLESSGAVTVLWEGKKTALLALVADGDGVAAGTYPSGRVLRAVPSRGPRSAEVLADLPEAEASVLLAGADGLAAVVTSNPAVLHRRSAGAREGRYVTAPLETGAVSRWGALSVVGEGVRAARVRHGETPEPDGSWSAWADVAGFDGRSGPTGVKARFVQIELTLAGASAELRSLAVIAQAPNRAPTLSAFTFAKPAKEEGASTKREIGWKVEDADGDELVTTVEVQREGSTRWAAVTKEQQLEKPGATWETAGLPDGLYRVRVTVSDAPGNPAGEARTSVLLAPPQRVDNAAPRVRASARVVGGRLLVEGTADDQTGGRVARVRVSLDGGPWLALGATDGIYDGALESFEGALDLPAPGEHDLLVQALDADDNAGAAGVPLSVPPSR